MASVFPSASIDRIGSFLRSSRDDPKFAASNEKIKILLSKVTRMIAYKSTYHVDVLKMELLLDGHSINTLSLVEHTQIIDDLNKGFSDCPLTCL